jgi:hypothetical protein
MIYIKEIFPSHRPAAIIITFASSSSLCPSATWWRLSVTCSVNLTISEAGPYLCHSPIFKSSVIYAKTCTEPSSATTKLRGLKSMFLEAGNQRFLLLSERESATRIQSRVHPSCPAGGDRAIRFAPHSSVPVTVYYSVGYSTAPVSRRPVAL